MEAAPISNDNTLGLCSDNDIFIANGLYNPNHSHLTI